MLRLLIAAWSDDASTWVGRRVELYRDPSITFGPNKVGGIRIAALSHLDKPLSIALTATRGKRVTHTIQPLPDAPADTTPHHLDAINTAATLDALKQAWLDAVNDGHKENPHVLAATNKRKAELTPKQEVEQ